MSVKVQVKNLGYVQKQDFKIAEAFEDVSNAVGNVANQTASDPSGADNTPAPIGGIQAVHLGNGLVDVSITDSGKVQRAVDYVVEFANNSGFAGSRVLHFSPSRNIAPTTLPNGNYWFKGYHQYRFGGPPSRPIVTGPISVTGSSGGALLPAQGCGVANPGTTGQGAGLTISR